MVALTLERLRLIDGVSEVTLQSSTQTPKPAGLAAATAAAAPAQGPVVRNADHLRSAAERVHDELPEHGADRDGERTDARHGFPHDIHRRCPMTGRDRIVIVVLAALAVVAAAWLLVLAPEREKASKLGAEVSTAQAQLTTAESQVNAARSAEAGYPAAYASLVSLGKAVPTGQEVPSLIFQLAQASNREAGRILLDHLAAAAPAARPSSSATPAAAAAGFTQMPFTFVFSGSFFDLYKLFQQINHFTLRTSAGVPAGQRPPAHGPGRAAGAPVGARARKSPAKS